MKLNSFLKKRRVKLIRAKEIGSIIDWVFQIHEVYSREPEKAVRKHDGKTPYGVHPTWCAMTLLQEPNLPEEFRAIGAQALLFHDILEDTTAELLDLDERVKILVLVKEMTFSNIEEEKLEIWKKSKEARLLKLYDKVSNLMDWSQKNFQKRQNHLIYVQKLIDDVFENFGELKLNIITIAKAIVNKKKEEENIK